MALTNETSPFSAIPPNPIQVMGKPLHAHHGQNNRRFTPLEIRLTRPLSSLRDRSVVLSHLLEHRGSFSLLHLNAAMKISNLEHSLTMAIAQKDYHLPCYEDAKKHVLLAENYTVSYSFHCNSYKWVLHPLLLFVGTSHWSNYQSTIWLSACPYTSEHLSFRSGLQPIPFLSCSRVSCKLHLHEVFSSNYLFFICHSFTLFHEDELVSAINLFDLAVGGVTLRNSYQGVITTHLRSIAQQQSELRELAVLARKHLCGNYFLMMRGKFALSEASHYYEVRVFYLCQMTDCITTSHICFMHRYKGPILSSMNTRFKNVVFKALCWLR